MFSLRKRFKLIEKENTSKDTVQFESLPVEIYLMIFDYLNGTDLIKFRLVNSFFKRLIDHTKCLWLYKLKIHVTFKRKFDTDHFMQFISNINNEMLVLDCRKVIKHQQENANQSLLNEKLFKIEFKYLNTLSLNCLNMFSNNCKYLKIDSFLNSYGQIKSETQSATNNASLLQYSNLNRLDISCLLYDLKQKKYFIWNDIYLDEFIQNKFKQLFVNLKELKINYYSGSNRSLIKCLKNLTNLTSLELDECQFTQDDYAVRESRKKLSNLKSINLVSVNLTLCLLVLKRLTNLNKLENFKLKLSNDHTSIKTSKTNNLIKELNDLLSNLNCNIHVIL